MARRISIRRILQTVTTLVALTGVVLAITAAGKMHKADKLRNVLVNIRNREAVGFIDKQAVLQTLFTDRHLNLAALPLAGIDIHRMEAILRSNPWIGSSEVWLDAARDLHIDVTQRVPAVRVYDERGQGYYLDTALAIIPLSDRYVHYAPVITGVPELHSDSSSDAIRGQIRYFFSVVNRDTFWRAQVAQTVLHAGYDFEIVPLLGSQRILVGDTADLPAKLARLFNFYSNVLNKIGWDKYDTLDLRFDGQVVARPALAWKKPYDKVAGGDGWMKVIMEAGPKEESDVNGALLTTLPGNGTDDQPASPRPAAPGAAAKPGATKRPEDLRRPAATPGTPAAVKVKAPAPIKKNTAVTPAKKPIQKPTREQPTSPAH